MAEINALKIWSLQSQILNIIFWNIFKPLKRERKKKRKIYQISNGQFNQDIFNFLLRRKNMNKITYHALNHMSFLLFDILLLKSINQSGIYKQISFQTLKKSSLNFWYWPSEFYACLGQTLFLAIRLANELNRTSFSAAYQDKTQLTHLQNRRPMSILGMTRYFKGWSSEITNLYTCIAKSMMRKLNT